jgi:hypothetical protein
MLAHWNNSLQIDVSHLSDTLSWLLFLLKAACLAVMQQIPILIVWFDAVGLEPTIYRTLGELAICITPPMGSQR